MMNLNLDQNEIQLIRISGGYMVRSSCQSFSHLCLLHLDELKNNYEAADDDNTDESKSNIPEFIEVNLFFKQRTNQSIFVDISFDGYRSRSE